MSNLFQSVTVKQKNLLRALWPEVKKKRHLQPCKTTTFTVLLLKHNLACCLPCSWDFSLFLFFFLPSSPALYLPPPPPDFNLSPSNSTTHTPPNGVCQCAQSWLSMHSELRIKAAALLNASKVICNARPCVLTCHSRTGIGKDKAFFQIPPPVPYTLYRHSDAV